MNLKYNTTFSNIPTYTKKYVTLKGGDTKFGNMKVCDTRDIIDIKKIQDDYNYLSKDKYIAEGYRFKNIVRYRYNGNTIKKHKIHEPLFQSKKVNPTHGDIIRHYDEYVPKHEDELMKILALFINPRTL